MRHRHGHPPLDRRHRLIRRGDHAVLRKPAWVKGTPWAQTPEGAIAADGPGLARILHPRWMFRRNIALRREPAEASAVPVERNTTPSSSTRDRPPNCSIFKPRRDRRPRIPDLYADNHGERHPEHGGPPPPRPGPPPESRRCRTDAPTPRHPRADPGPVSSPRRWPNRMKDQSQSESPTDHHLRDVIQSLAGHAETLDRHAIRKSRRLCRQHAGLFQRRNAWAALTFRRGLPFLRECPCKRLRSIPSMPNILDHKMLLGAVQTGRHTPNNPRQRGAVSSASAAASGVDVFRVFGSAWNWGVENMRVWPWIASFANEKVLRRHGLLIPAIWPIRRGRITIEILCRPWPGIGGRRRHVLGPKGHGRAWKPNPGGQC